MGYHISMRYICYSFVWFFWFITFTSRSTLLPNTSNNLDSRNFYNAYLSLSKLGTPRDLIHIRRKQVYRRVLKTLDMRLGDRTILGMKQWLLQLSCYYFQTIEFPLHCLHGHLQAVITNCWRSPTILKVKMNIRSQRS